MATIHLGRMMPFGTAPASFPGRAPFGLGTGAVVPPGAILLRNATPVTLRDGSPLIARS